MVETILWAVLAVALLIIEAITTGFGAIWFCIGATVAFLMSIGNAPLIAQLIVFLAVSIIMYVVTRVFVKRSVETKKQATNADRIIGSIAVVTETINGHEGTGTVRIDGKLWAAKCDDKERIIDIDTEVKINRIEGVKVIVQ